MKPCYSPRVKICCIKSVAEAWMAVNCGASALGLVSSMPSGPGVIDDESIAKISRQVPPPIATFLLTSKTDPSAIVAQHRLCGTSTIQLCDYLPSGSHEIIRSALPGIKLVQVIHVLSEDDVTRSLQIAPQVDALLLDSGNPSLAVKKLGGTGCIHNWKLSRKVRESVEIPIFLAGGISADNVAEAITEVSPFGLDLCSSVRSNDNLDREKLGRFFAAVAKLRSI